MNQPILSPPTTLASFITLIKAIAIGVIAGEAVAFSFAISEPFTRLIDAANTSNFAFIFYSLITLLLLFSYLYARDFHLLILKIIHSRRIDSLVMLVVGIYISISFLGIGYTYYKRFAENITDQQLLLLLGTPILFAFLLLARALLDGLNALRDRPAPIFLSDIEQTNIADDLLDLAIDSERFSESVFNGGAPDSVVFGIDAPWGIGKSSFVNFCIENWQLKHPNDVIVFKFNLLRYESRSKILEKFVDGLIRTIHKHIFIPELQPLISRYSRFLRGKRRLSFLGFDFELGAGERTLDDVFEDIERELYKINKKIIVVIDDLDRIPFSNIKNVLFSIKKAFTLPNVSYVLCYDSENIASQSNLNVDSEKIIEFLEKFVNVKISLFLHTDTLKQYVSKNFDKAVKRNRLLDPYTKDKLKQILDTLIQMYDSKDYHRYEQLIGDIRKLKRLINALVLFEIDKTDFENSDIEKKDLIHLLLIYINYPNIFRKIYSTETDRRRGFFSLTTRYDEGFPKGSDDSGPRENEFSNSQQYAKFCKSRTCSQRFLLDSLFSISQRIKNGDIENANRESIPELIKNSLACFNGDRHGGGRRNLEKYLNLIVKLSRPQKIEEYKFYINKKDELINGKSIEEIFSDTAFDFSEGERTRAQFIRVVINSADEFTFSTIDQIISYLLKNISEYSSLEIETLGLGARTNLTYSLLSLLDSLAWTYHAGKRQVDEAGSISRIAARIFGDSPYSECDVVNSLGGKSKGPLGLYDLMIFRLYCCADRGSKLFNIQRALATHGEANAPVTGELSKIVVPQMRELSQKVFSLFNSLYIESKVNLFDAIDSLTIDEMAGKNIHYINSSLSKRVIANEDVDKSIAALKSRIKVFVIYQLGNTKISSGVGCGFYDSHGNSDHKEINSIINDYLFNHCFNPEISMRNYEHFLDYLLINFASRLESEDGQYKPTIVEFTKVLNLEKLSQYWRLHSSHIKELGFSNKEKTVITGNYSATYKEDLPSVYEVLDKAISGSI